VRRAAGTALAGAAIAAAVVAIGVAEGWWQGASAPEPSAAISTQASLSPGAVQFGDRLTATAQVVVDPARVVPASVRLVPHFLSYRVAAAVRELHHAGGLAKLSYTFRLECLTAGCAPGRPQVALQFPPARLVFRTRGGAQGHRAVAWPTITVASRLDDADRADPGGHLRADATPPPASYSVSPDALVDGLVAAAGLLVLAAGGLLLLAFRRTASPVPAPTPPRRPPLEEVMALVRATALNGGSSELRRLALQRLARELRRSERDELAEGAGRLAWSDGAPSADATGALVDEVEREVSP